MHGGGRGAQTDWTALWCKVIGGHRSSFNPKRRRTQTNAADGPTQDAGEAEVAQLDDAGLGEEDVLRLYVPVDALKTQTVRIRVWQHEAYIKLRSCSPANRTNVNTTMTSVVCLCVFIVTQPSPSADTWWVASATSQDLTNFLFREEKQTRQT